MKFGIDRIDRDGLLTNGVVYDELVTFKDSHRVAHWNKKNGFRVLIVRQKASSSFWIVANNRSEELEAGIEGPYTLFEAVVIMIAKYQPDDEL